MSQLTSDFLFTVMEVTALENNMYIINDFCLFESFLDNTFIAMFIFGSI